MHRERPDWFEDHFAISALGRDFDVDAFLAESTLTFDQIWRRADLLSEFAFDQGFVSGVSKVLGDGFETAFYDQQRIAGQFIAEHFDALKHLGKFDGVEMFTLTVHTVVDQPAAAVVLDWFPSLLGPALELGLRLAFYVDLPRETRC